MPDALAAPATSPRRCDIRLEVARRIAEHDAGEWDSILAPDDVQLTHRFVRTCEDAGIEDADYWHVMAYEGNNLVGVATLCALTVSLELLSPGWVRHSILFARRWQPSVLRMPILVCGLPVSFGQPCIAVRLGTNPAPVLSALDGLMEEIARDRRIRLLCFKEFDVEQVQAMEPLTGLGYFAAASLPSWTLDLRWRSFADYVGAMRAPYRRQVRASLDERRARGLTIRTVDDFGPYAELIYGLYAEVMIRAKHRLEHLNRDFFTGLGRNLGSASRAILVERGTDVLAAAIIVRTPAVLTFLLAGIDYERNVQNSSYLNLVLEVVSRAIQDGARRLELGQTSDHLKSRLGARSTARWVFLRHRSRASHGLLHKASGLLFPATAVPQRRVLRSSVDPDPLP